MTPVRQRDPCLPAEHRDAVLDHAPNHELGVGRRGELGGHGKRHLGLRTAVVPDADRAQTGPGLVRASHRHRQRERRVVEQLATGTADRGVTRRGRVVGADDDEIRAGALSEVAKRTGRRPVDNRVDRRVAGQPISLPAQRSGYLGAEGLSVSHALHG
jgi:hypothetical protein